MKLRAIRPSRDPKKIIDTINQLLRVEKVTIQIPHLEDKEIFGSTKWKLDLLLGDDGDSHGPNKVNFLLPQVQTMSRVVYTKFAKTLAVAPDREELPHVTTALEFDYDMSQWHSARI